MSDVGEWLKSLPIFTRYWLQLTVAVSLIARFGIVNNQYLILLYKPLINKFQIWRPMTALFFYPLTPNTGFHFLMNCYFLYNYSLRLENDFFGGRPAEYLFLLVFNWICCVIGCLLLQIPVMLDPMVMSVLYVWCQLNSEVIVPFWFGSRFKAAYIPWLMTAFKLMVSAGGSAELLGILVGHIYFFLMFSYPQQIGGLQLIKTPQIFYDWFPNRRTFRGFGGTLWQPQRGNGGDSRRHNWGQGHVLGDNQ